MSLLDVVSRILIPTLVGAALCASPARAGSDVLKNAEDAFNEIEEPAEPAAPKRAPARTPAKPAAAKPAPKVAEAPKAPAVKAAPAQPQAAAKPATPAAKARSKDAVKAGHQIVEEFLANLLAKDFEKAMASAGPEFKKHATDAELNGLLDYITQRGQGRYVPEGGGPLDDGRTLLHGRFRFANGKELFIVTVIEDGRIFSLQGRL